MNCTFLALKGKRDSTGRWKLLKGSGDRVPKENWGSGSIDICIYIYIY